jgi:hypothetical protein
MHLKWEVLNKSFLGDGNSIATQMHESLYALTEEKQFTDIIEIEFEELVKSIVNLKEKSNLGFGGVCTLEPGDVLEAIVDLTDLDGIQITLDKVPIALKILRKIIEIENPNSMLPAAEWIGDEAEPSDGLIKNQNLMANADGCYLVANLICHKKGNEINSEAMLLGIAMLLGGNNVAQTKFWEYMTEDIENKFLIILSDLLKSNFFKIMNHAEESNKLAK